MIPFQRSLTLTSPENTAQIAAAIAPHLRAGDTLLLEGGIGAGKTFFCRSLIQTLLPTPEDIPSPTFTLVQTYETSEFPIWHCDLYRLTHPDEAWELGLEDAFDTALCLIEWPDRLGAEAPKSALTLTFEASDDDTRLLTLHSNSTAWQRLDGVLNV
jgi:tRNA threonylcarbamoyl adenosine modification protein YjeE